MVKTEGYPTLELPVAQFTHPEDAEFYQGASELANFILRQTIDHAPTGSPSVLELLAARKLWVITTFRYQHRSSIYTDMQVSSERLWLSATSGRTSFAMRWKQQPSGAYVPDMVKQEAPVFPYQGDQKPLEITPQTYHTLPTHAQFQADPALRFDAAFSHYKSDLEYFPPASVDVAAIRTLADKLRQSPTAPPPADS